MARSIAVLVAAFLGVQVVFAGPPADKPLPAKLPLSGQAPAKLVPDLCLLRYRVSTDSPDMPGILRPGTGLLVFLRLRCRGASVRDGRASRSRLCHGLVGPEPRL